MSASSPALPPELWIQVARAIKIPKREHMEDGGVVEQDANYHDILALQNLSLTSKSFLEIARPILFESISIIGPKANSLDRAKYIGRLFVSNDLARGWIKDLVIISPNRSLSGVHAQISNTLFDNHSSNILLQTTSLRSLALNGVELTHELLFHLLHLSHSSLRRLTLEELTWNGPEPSGNLIANIKSQVHSLKTTHLATRQRLAKGFDPILPIISLFLLGPSLKRISLDQASALYVYHPSSQIHSQNFQHLQCLEVPEPVQSSLGSFIAFLNQCPNIISIKLIPRWVSIPQELEWSTPVGVAPQLREYWGPYSPARILISGRPLESLSLQTGSFIPLLVSKTFLESLNQGSAHLRCLELRGVKWDDEILSNILSVFGTLESLTLTGIHYQAVRCFLLMVVTSSDQPKGPANSLDVFPNAPASIRLQRLRLSSVNLSHDEPPHAPTIRKQRAAAKNASQKYPSLEELSLVSGVFWFRQPASEDWIVNFGKERTRKIFEPKVDPVRRLFNHDGELLRHASLGMNWPSTQS